MKFFIKQDIDFDFLILLTRYYGKLLSSSFLKDEYSYTIFSVITKVPIGIIQYDPGKNQDDFLRLALVPEMKGRGIGQDVFKEFIKQFNIKKINWVVHKNNYPSLKFLQKFNCGLFAAQEQRQYKEGIFRTDCEIPYTMKRNLDIATIAAEDEYVMNDFIDLDIRAKIDSYLHNYIKINK